MTHCRSHRSAHRSVRTLLAVGAVLFGAAPGCIQPQEGLPASASIQLEQFETPGISGKPPTPSAHPGQTLPLEPARTVAFTTSEGTHLSLDVSPDGASIIFDMLGDIYHLPIAGGEAKALTRGMALDTQPVYAPDGRSILFLSDRSGAENLWLMDSDGQNARQVSFYDDNPVWVSPEWSPDGSRIIASRFWSDRNSYELWEFNAVPGAMGEAVRVTQPASPEKKSFSSLGATFSHGACTHFLTSRSDDSVSFNELAAWKVLSIDPSTGEEQVLAGSALHPAMRPRLSPDDRHLAYAERRANRTFLMLKELATGETSQLGELDPDSLQASPWHDAVPRFDFLPDGSALIANAEGRLRRFPVSGDDPVDIPFRANVDQPLGPLVRDPIPLDTGPVRARLLMSPTLSPDGKAIAFSALGNVYTARPGEGEEPHRLTEALTSTYHPAWSANGEELAFVSWTKKDGGQVWTIRHDGNGLRRVTTDDAFYSHPTFTPDGSALIVVRSSTQDRHTTYMEYGQLREADLIYLPLNGDTSRVLTSGYIGGRPHFGNDAGRVMFNSDEGVEAVSLEVDDRVMVTQAVGPNWYFAEGSASADDLRVSPDGRWALALIAHQLHLYKIPENAGGAVDLSAPSTPHVRVTDIGADYFGWSADSASLYWSVGSTIYRLSLGDIDFGKTGRQHPVPSEAMYALVDEFAISAAREPPGRTVLLTGATVFPMDDRSHPERMIPKADILLTDGKIAAIGGVGSVDAAGDLPRIDLSGHYIIPGLIDAHYHVADIRRDVLQFDSWGLKTNLAHGITTLFDPSSLTIDMLTYQDLLETGEILGSRLFTTGPAIFDYNDFRSKAEVEAVLTRYRNHYRLRNLKQYRVGNRRVRQWFAESARELGMTPTTEGALSYKLGLSQIIDGYSGNEHALPPPVLHRDMTELFAKSGTSSTLTLMITHGGVPADTSFITRRQPLNDQKYARFAPDWFMQREFADVSALDQDQFLYPAFAASAHRVHLAGGHVGVGAHGDLPGLGTIWEIQAYVEGGWQPAEAIWAATMGSAETIARDDSLGSLVPGKVADLVVLAANPAENIRSIEKPVHVMKDGHLYDGETLREHVLTRTP